MPCSHFGWIAYCLLTTDRHEVEEIDWRGDVEKMLTQSPKGFANMNLLSQRGHSFVRLYLVILFTEILVGLLGKGEFEHSLISVRSSVTPSVHKSTSY